MSVFRTPNARITWSCETGSLVDLENDVEPTDFTLKKAQRERHQLWDEAMAQPVDMKKILRLAEPKPNARKVDKKRKKH